MMVPPEQPQALQPLVHSCQGRVQRAAERLGNLPELLALVDALTDHLALSGWQLLQQVAQTAGLVGLDQRVERSRQGVGLLGLLMNRTDVLESSRLPAFQQQRLM